MQQQATNGPDMGERVAGVRSGQGAGCFNWHAGHEAGGIGIGYRAVCAGSGYGGVSVSPELRFAKGAGSNPCSEFLREAQ